MESSDLPKPERLKGKVRFSEIFDKGVVAKSKLVITRVLPNDLNSSRFAPVAGKSAGKAFYRNRLKRRLRSAFRSIVNPELPAGYDYIFIARRGVDTADFGVLAAQMCDSAKSAIEKITRGKQ